MGSAHVALLSTSREVVRAALDASTTLACASLRCPYRGEQIPPRFAIATIVTLSISYDCMNDAGTRLRLLPGGDSRSTPSGFPSYGRRNIYDLLRAIDGPPGPTVSHANPVIATNRTHAKVQLPIGRFREPPESDHPALVSPPVGRMACGARSLHCQRRRATGQWSVGCRGSRRPCRHPEASPTDRRRQRRQ